MRPPESRTVETPVTTPLIASDPMSRSVAGSVRCLASSILVSMAVTAGATAPAHAQEADALRARIDAAVTQVNGRVVAWRRDIHQNPELGNREFRTSKLVADHLRSLGLEVQTGIAHTGVVGMLRGGKPGPLVALRADMDALPVAGRVALRRASKERAEQNGQEVGVMIACGHANHVAILRGVAETPPARKSDRTGAVMCVSQPAGEGEPAGEEGGAQLMLK